MFFLKKIYRKFTNWRWEIGFVDNSFAGLVDEEPLKVHWVELPLEIDGLLIHISWIIMKRKS